jgi:hypothetical protein
MGTSHPPTYTTVARALASVRTLTWTSAQLSILDLLINALADDLYEINPRFNPEQFKTLAHYRRGRINHQ